MRRVSPLFSLFLRNVSVAGLSLVSLSRYAQYLGSFIVGGKFIVRGSPGGALDDEQIGFWVLHAVRRSCVDAAMLGSFALVGPRPLSEHVLYCTPSLFPVFTCRSAAVLTSCLLACEGASTVDTFSSVHGGRVFDGEYDEIVSVLVRRKCFWVHRIAQTAGISQQQCWMVTDGSRFRATVLYRDRRRLGIGWPLHGEQRQCWRDARRNGCSEGCSRDDDANVTDTTAPLVWLLLGRAAAMMARRSQLLGVQLRR